MCPDSEGDSSDTSDCCDLVEWLPSIALRFHPITADSLVPLLETFFMNTPVEEFRRSHCSASDWPTLRDVCKSMVVLISSAILDDITPAAKTLFRRLDIKWQEGLICIKEGDVMANLTEIFPRCFSDALRVKGETCDVESLSQAQHILDTIHAVDYLARAMEVHDEVCRNVKMELVELVGRRVTQRVNSLLALELNPQLCVFEMKDLVQNSMGRAVTDKISSYVMLMILGCLVLGWMVKLAEKEKVKGEQNKHVKTLEAMQKAESDILVALSDSTEGPSSTTATASKMSKCDKYDKYTIILLLVKELMSPTEKNRKTLSDKQFDNMMNYLMGETTNLCSCGFYVREELAKKLQMFLFMELCRQFESPELLRVAIESQQPPLDGAFVKALKSILCYPPRKRKNSLVVFFSAIGKCFTKS